jgi:hypothetical protein
MDDCGEKFDRLCEWREWAAAAGVSIEKVLPGSPLIERAIQRYQRSVQVQKTVRANAAAIRKIHGDAVAVARGAPRSRRLALAEAVAVLKPAFRVYLSKGERFYGPMPTPGEIRGEATAREAAARLRDRLQYGVAPSKWSQELNQLEIAAQSAERAFCIASGEVPDSATDEIRKRRQECAWQRLHDAQKKVATHLKGLSTPTVKRLHSLARSAAISLPSVDGVTSSRAAIRDLLKILECGRRDAVQNFEEGHKDSRPLLHARSFRPGRPSNELACAFVGEMAIVWRCMTGKSPSRTASHHHRGPFVRFVAVALRMAGTPHIDAVKLVNECGNEGMLDVRRASRFNSPIEVDGWGCNGNGLEAARIVSP